MPETQSTLTTLADVLQRMRAAERLPITGSLSEPVEPDDLLRPLVEEVVRLESVARTDRAATPSVTAEAKRRWKASGGRIDELTAREIRALCGEPTIATDSAFVRGIASLPELVSKRQWIERLVESYLTEWRRMGEPDALEQLLRRAVTEFAGRSTILAKYKPVVRWLFSGSAPAALGTQVVAERRTIQEVLEEWRVPAAGGLGEATAAAALDEWVVRFEKEKRTLRGAAAFGWFRQLTQELLAAPMLDPKRVGRAVSSLILWDEAEQDETLRDHIQTFLFSDSRFGDPRLPRNSNNWSKADPAARQQVVAWLSRRDLVFFFDFVIRDDPHGRKDFWLKYIGHVVDSHVALSEDDAWRLRAEVKDKVAYSIATAGQGTSAFLMRFKGTRDILCVEFSQSGNALYVHHTDKFLERNDSIRVPSFHVRYDLKSTSSAFIKFNHFTMWQSDVRTFLSRDGIRL